MSGNLEKISLFPNTHSSGKTFKMSTGFTFDGNTYVQHLVKPRLLEKTQPLPDVAVIIANPILAGNSELASLMFDHTVRAGAKAIVLEGYATGTTPESLNAAIKKCVEVNEVPVFIISKNPANDFGVRSLKYETQVLAVEAGATPLRDVNINDEMTVLVAIQDAVNKGLSGTQLRDAIIERFGSPVEDYERKLFS